MLITVDRYARVYKLTFNRNNLNFEKIQSLIQLIPTCAVESIINASDDNNKRP